MKGETEPRHCSLIWIQSIYWDSRSANRRLLSQNTNCTVASLYYVEDDIFQSPTTSTLLPHSKQTNTQCGVIIQPHRPRGGGVNKKYCFVLLYMSLYLYSQRECCCCPVFYLRSKENSVLSASAVLSQNNAFLNRQTHALKRLAAGTHWLGGAL
jgi:hypothetical protein